MSEKLKSLNILKFGKIGIRLFIDLFHRMKDSKNFGFQDQIQGDVVSIPSRVTEGYHSKGSEDSILLVTIQVLN